MGVLAYRVGVVTVAALLTGPVLAGSGQATADNAVQKLDAGGAGQILDGAAPDSAGGSDDGSVINPDPDAGDADVPDDDGGQGDSGSDGPPATSPA